MKARYSKQRAQIWACLKDNTNHPTAEMVYQTVRKTCPEISLGTVYRNLAFFKSDDRLKALDFGDGKVHYDPNLAPHDHFFCEKCGTIYDLPMTSSPEDETLLQVRLAAPIGRISHASTCYYGLCADCENQEGKETE